MVIHNSPLLGLLLSSKSHRSYPLWAVQANILSGLNSGNFRLYAEDEKPNGFVIWTFLTFDEIKSLIESGGVMKSNFWRKTAVPGSVVFIVELIADASIFNLIRSDLEDIFHNQSAVYGLSWKNSLKPRIRKVKNRLMKPGNPRVGNRI